MPIAMMQIVRQCYAAEWLLLLAVVVAVLLVAFFREMYRRRLHLWAASLLVMAAAVCVLLFFRSEIVRSGDEHKRVRELCSRLERGCPSHMEARRWDDACAWTRTAIVNVCAPGHVDVDEFTRLRKGLERRMSGPVGVETLCWIWDELERIEPTGRYGNDYVKRYRPEFEKSLDGRSE